MQLNDLCPLVFSNCTVPNNPPNHTTACLVTRIKAKSLGYRRFFTGKPCHQGHVAERYVCNKQCVQCNAESARDRERQRCKIDASHRMFRSVQRRSGQRLKGRYSPSKALGCTSAELRDHVANRFTEGMSWDNYGHWEVDHIQPLSAATDLGDLILLCDYQNVQPLWKRANRVKGGAV